MDSPVSIASSTADSPSKTTPSTGTRSPGLSTTRSPAFSSATGTSSSCATGAFAGAAAKLVRRLKPVLLAAFGAALAGTTSLRAVAGASVSRERKALPALSLTRASNQWPVLIKEIIAAASMKYRCPSAPLSKAHVL